MNDLANALDQFRTTQILPLTITIIILALTAVGFGFIIGTRQIIDWAKNHLFHIVIGTVLIYLAVNIVTSVVQSLGGPTGFALAPDPDTLKTIVTCRISVR